MYRVTLNKAFQAIEAELHRLVVSIESLVFLCGHLFVACPCNTFILIFVVVLILFTMPTENEPRCPPPRYEIKISTILSILSAIFLLWYYLSGYHYLPLSIILPIAGHVLARGLVAVNDVIVNLIGLLALKIRIPLDLLTCAILEMDTRTGRNLSWPYIIVGGFVTLFFVNTPEVLLGTLATGRNDIRETSEEVKMIELASFGGSFNKSVYYTSGMVLAGSSTPDVSYREVGYKAGDMEWVVPRKPTVWYRRFAEVGRLNGDVKPGHPHNDLESRIDVWKNDVVILRRAERPTAGDVCQKWNGTDFGYSITMLVCNSKKFGFKASGPDLAATESFFTFWTGTARVHYRSVNNNRYMSGSELKEQEIVELPRPDLLWKDMGHCLLNAISFNRARGSSMAVPEKLALSSIMRTAGLEHKSGFSDPALMARARVMEVRSSNVSRFVVVTMWVAVGLIVMCDVFFSCQTRVVSRELGQWIQMGQELADNMAFSSWPRYTRYPERPKNLLVRLERVNALGKRALLLRMAE